MSGGVPPLPQPPRQMCPCQPAPPHVLPTAADRVALGGAGVAGAAYSVVGVVGVVGAAWGGRTAGRRRLLLCLC